MSIKNMLPITAADVRDYMREHPSCSMQHAKKMVMRNSLMCCLHNAETLEEIKETIIEIFNEEFGNQQ